MERVDCGEEYLCWSIKTFTDPLDNTKKLSEFLEWDYCYQISKMLKQYDRSILEPWECYELANHLLEDGRYDLDLHHLDIWTPCGKYVGK